MPVIVWFSSDLRLTDQPALEAGHGDYPVPIVDHRRARQAALAAYDRIKGERTG